MRLLTLGFGLIFTGLVLRAEGPFQIGPENRSVRNDAQVNTLMI